MPVVIGTAGHIDHGKTALVRALTGQDTDRLKEEKERGISIDLGFAWFDAPDGTRAGVVDVPGHERFIRNMLAGAHGMDLVLFTVAADDGVMPQTEEHLDILHLLGVRRGIWVVTKIDLVDAERVAAVREEIEILAVDSTLEGAPILPVSATTGEGVEVLRAEIAHQLSLPAPPAGAGPFRLPVDRAFVMRGHGVVVTGTAIAGTVRDGDVVRILPGGDEVRVRNLQVHGTAVAEARHGQRVALNLAGIERQDLGRGHVVCDVQLAHTTTRFDAFVEVRPGARRPLATHGRVRVHLGTAEVVGKVVVLGGRPGLAPRERGWAQLALAEPVLALRGDRFILRDETARWTLGGGVVVNPFADRHRRDEPDLAEKLAALRDGDDATAARTLLGLVPSFACDGATIASALGVDPGRVGPSLARAPDVVPIAETGAPEAYTTTEKWERLRADVLARVAAAHGERPLEPGVEMEHLRSQVPFEVSARTFRWCIERLCAEKVLVREESLVRLPEHKVALATDARALGERLERLLAEGRFTPPDLRQLGDALEIPRARLAQVLGVLEKERRVVRVAPDLYYAPDAAEEAKRLLADHCRTHGEISAGAFRDLIGASRKFAIAFLDWCDRTGVTTRVGDLRRLRR
ncbi:MAG TPA: selenocysteine-specific translation elongation factor [Candidatus Eisenbacteria bacterium]|nr:selenocysteine-specific translation elongation factor [Candidatus Eisenbacteria bacterium]